MATVTVLTDERMIAHDPGPGHPERPARLRAILDDLARAPIVGVETAAPRPATAEELSRVHDAAFVDAILATRGRAVVFDPDTATNADSVDAALLAAGSAIEAVERAGRTMALVRPPGHHAERDRAMGFCLFGNVAVAAQHARATGRAERVMIVDWDVHHGNGTQHLFEDRADVLVVSSHHMPDYPGTGAATEIGRGAGRGYTVNLPFATGDGDETVVGAYARLVPALAEAFRPDLVLVSAGFDAHASDTISALTVSDDGFAALCGIVLDAAVAHADGRIALVLEGGYHLIALAAGVRRCLEVLTGVTPPTIDVDDARTSARLAPVLEAHRGKLL